MAGSSRKTSSETIAPRTGPPISAMGEDSEKNSQAALAPSAAAREFALDVEQRFQPKSFKFWSVIISIFLALFLVALDRTILGTATPQITQEFHSLGDIGWYSSAYQLTTAASQLLFGRVFKFYEIKRTFLVTVLLFEIGSAICGAAPNSIAFIFGRAIAGLGSAGIFSGVSIIMIGMVPLRKRPMFQGLFGTVFGIASVLGPLVGGALTDGASWRWCFYINLPIGAVASLCLICFLRPSKYPQTPATIWQQILRLDPLGTFFFVPSIVSLLLTLQWGGSTFAWSNWRIIILFVLFGVLLAAFAAVQVFMPKTATVPIRVISQRSMLAATVFMLALCGSFLMAIFYLPLWFQVIQGASATQSGINTLPFVLSLVVGSTLSGAFTHKVGYYVPAMIASPSLLAVGTGLMSTFRVDEPSSHWIGFQVIAGFGLGLGMQSSSLAAQAVLPIPDIPIGIAVLFFAQQLGGAVFTSVGQNILSTYLVSHLNIPGLSPDAITGTGATDLVSNVAPEFKSVVKDVYNQAISKIFLCSMGVSLVAVVSALFLEWKNVKKTGPPGASPGAAPGATGAPPGTGERGRTDSMSEGEWFVDSPGESSSTTKARAMFDDNEILAPSSLKSGCEHCEHCQLSRALTTTAPEKQGLSPPSSHPTNVPSAAALEEAARLASIARTAVAQLEELSWPLSSSSATTTSKGPFPVEGIPSRPEKAYFVQNAPRRSSLAILHESLPGDSKREPTEQELMENAQRVSSQLEREELVREVRRLKEREQAASRRFEESSREIGLAVSPMSSRYSGYPHRSTM